MASLPRGETNFVEAGQGLPSNESQRNACPRDSRGFPSSASRVQLADSKWSRFATHIPPDSGSAGGVANQKGPLCSPGLMAVSLCLVLKVEPKSTIGAALIAQSSQFFKIGNDASFGADFTAARGTDIPQV